MGRKVGYYMKKIIFVILCMLMCVCQGCSDEEVMEIISEEGNKEQFSDNEQISDNAIDVAKDTGVENTEKTENIETNDSQSFVVYVSGYVNNPGVYELSAGSRVIDAIDAAGGYSKEAYDNYLNLASLIADGQMIYVPSEEEVESGSIERGVASGADGSGVGGVTGGNGGGNGGNSSDSGTLVNINQASKEELMTLPGIGESKADKIIAYREENGRFSTPEGIMEISGIKDGLYNKIKDKICAN